MAATEREVLQESSDHRESSRQLNTQTSNVGDAERWITSIGGGALIGYGVIRRSPLGAALAIAGAALAARGIVGRSMLYRTLGLDHPPSIPNITLGNLRGAETSVHVEQALTVEASPEELYQFWRDFSRLPQFMNHLQSVEVLDDRRSCWTAKAPLGSSVSWDAEITEDRPNELISWRSLPDADIENVGSVRFERASGDRGTVVHVTIGYNPPAGKAGAIVARVLGEEPSTQVKTDLGRFKQLIEAGEVTTTLGQSHGQRSALGKVFSPNS